MTQERIEASVRSALELALAEFENQKAGLEEVGVTDHSLDDLITTIKAALEAHKALMSLQDGAQPAVQQGHEQEPVTWRNAAIRVGEDLCSVGPFGYYDMTAEQWLDWALSVVTVHSPPPQRTWVGLTDEDFAEACQMAERGNYLVAFQRIQAKLKEKNT